MPRYPEWLRRLADPNIHYKNAEIRFFLDNHEEESFNFEQFIIACFIEKVRIVRSEERVKKWQNDLTDFSKLLTQSYDMMDLNITDTGERKANDDAKLKKEPTIKNPDSYRKMTSNEINFWKENSVILTCPIEKDQGREILPPLQEIQLKYTTDQYTKQIQNTFERFGGDAIACDHHSESTLETTLTNKNEEIYYPLCESDGHDAWDCPRNLYCLECKIFGCVSVNGHDDDQILESKENIELNNLTQQETTVIEWLANNKKG